MKKEYSPMPDKEGYWERNYARLAAFSHRRYMVSRILFAKAWLVVAGFFAVDAFIIHGSKGTIRDITFAFILFVVGNWVRRTKLRGLQVPNENVRDVEVKPRYDPKEPWWVRLGFRLPFFQRRGLTGFMALLNETFFLVLMAAGLYAQLVTAGMREFLPHIFSEVTFPVDSWMLLAIMVGAEVGSWINNAIFLLKYPKVQEALLKTLRDYLGNDHSTPSKTVALQLVDVLRARSDIKRDCDPEEISAKLMLLLTGALGKNLTEKKTERLRELIDEVVALIKKDEGNNKE